MEHRRVLLLAVVAVACSYCAACASARDIYYRAAHQRVRLPSGNMEPSIKIGDEAAVDPDYYKGHLVERFDIVTYKLSPENIPPDTDEMNEETLYLTRVVGLGGETLEIKGGKVYIDGRVLDEPFATVPLSEAEPFGPVKIPAGEFFLLGDNRPNSLDSRYWARPTLKEQNILGKVVQVFPQ